MKATDTFLKLAVCVTLDQLVHMCKETSEAYDVMPASDRAKSRMLKMLRALDAIGELRFPHDWDRVSPQRIADEAKLKKLM